MNKKVDYKTIGSEGIRLMNEFDAYLNKYDIDPILRELIKVRTSQINGCAYCIDVHTKMALRLGETPQRIFVLSIWRDADFFSDAEKAVLALVEHVTLISDQRVPAEIYEDVLKYFSEEDYVMFVYMINHMNAWNRLSISMGNRAQ